MAIWKEVGGLFLFLSITMLIVGWSFILWSKLYLEGWPSRSSYFIDVALFELFYFPLSYLLIRPLVMTSVGVVKLFNALQILFTIVI